MSDQPEAVVEPILQPLDIQHDTDPADDHGPARRIPHMGHAILFFSLAFLIVNVCALGIFTALHIHLDAIQDHPNIGLGTQALAYLLTLVLSAQIFPRLWQRSFLHGLQWNVLAAHRHWRWIIPAAIALSFAAQAAQYFLPTPEKVAVEDLMKTPMAAYFTAAFAVLLAPLTEEIAFRGFLLPALATAYDWLSLERTPAGLQRWENSSMHSTSALVFAAIFSSIPFALLHAGQLSHAWGVVGVLFCVSLVFSYVRIRTHSVACSALMHAIYNLTIFIAIYVSTGGFRHLENLHK
jgi:membrane protease YdiL (CAAX protease family)